MGLAAAAAAGRPSTRGPPRALVGPKPSTSLTSLPRRGVAAWLCDDDDPLPAAADAGRGRRRARRPPRTHALLGGAGPCLLPPVRSHAWAHPSLARLARTAANPGRGEPSSSAGAWTARRGVGVPPATSDMGGVREAPPHPLWFEKAHPAVAATCRPPQQARGGHVRPPPPRLPSGARPARHAVTTRAEPRGIGRDTIGRTRARPSPKAPGRTRQRIARRRARRTRRNLTVNAAARRPCGAATSPSSCQLSRRLPLGRRE